MDMQKLRRQIDDIDDDLVRLFQQRMDVSAEIARYKSRHNLPIYDPAREQHKLHDLVYKGKEGYRAYITALYTLIFELSRDEQERMMRS